MNEKNADGKATEGKKTCKNPAGRLRQELLNGMIKANEEMAAEIQEMAASLDELKVEADDAEEELEAQKRTLADAEKRTEILDAEEKRLSEQSEFCRSVETIAKNRICSLLVDSLALRQISLKNQRMITLKEYVS
jgi:molecular chaperone DnaK (HSP70)